MLFKHHQDIRAVLKKPRLRSLVEQTTVEEDKRKEGGQECMTMTFLGLLVMIPSCMPPETVLLRVSSCLNPRAYSLSRSPLATPNTISRVFTLVTMPRLGMATTWMSNLQAMPEGITSDSRLVSW
jgi:sulfite reductase alpha subunit-like flavoprotein